MGPRHVRPAAPMSLCTCDGQLHETRRRDAIQKEGRRRSETLDRQSTKTTRTGGDETTTACDDRQKHPTATAVLQRRSPRNDFARHRNTWIGTRDRACLDENPAGKFQACTVNHLTHAARLLHQERKNADAHRRAKMSGGERTSTLTIDAYPTCLLMPRHRPLWRTMRRHSHTEVTLRRRSSTRRRRPRTFRHRHRRHLHDRQRSHLRPWPGHHLQASEEKLRLVPCRKILATRALQQLQATPLRTRMQMSVPRRMYPTAMAIEQYSENRALVDATSRHRVGPARAR